MSVFHYGSFQDYFLQWDVSNRAYDVNVFELDLKQNCLRFLIRSNMYSKALKVLHCEHAAKGGV